MSANERTPPLVGGFDRDWTKRDAYPHKFAEYFGHLYVQITPQNQGLNEFSITIDVPPENETDSETAEILDKIQKILNSDEIWRVVEIDPPAISEKYRYFAYGGGQMVKEYVFSGRASAGSDHAALAYKFIENCFLDALEEEHPAKRSGARHRFTPVDQPELVPAGFSYMNRLQEGLQPWYSREYLSLKGKDDKRYYLISYDNLQSIEGLYDLAMNPDFRYSVFNNKIHHGPEKKITLPLPKWNEDKNEALPWYWVTRKLMLECRNNTGFAQAHPDLDAVNPDASVLCAYIEEIYDIHTESKDNSIILALKEGDKLPSAICIKDFFDYELKDAKKWRFSLDRFEEWPEFAKQLVNEHGASAGGVELFPADELFGQPLPLPDKENIVYLGIGTYVWPDYEGRGLGARITAEAIRYLQYQLKQQGKELGLASGCSLTNIGSMTNILRRGMQPLLDENGHIVIVGTVYEDGPRPVFFMKGDAIDKLVQEQPEQVFTPQQILEMVKAHHSENKIAIEWADNGLKAIEEHKARSRTPVGKFTAAIHAGTSEKEHPKR